MLFMQQKKLFGNRLQWWCFHSLLGRWGGRYGNVLRSPGLQIIARILIKLGFSYREIIKLNVMSYIMVEANI